MQNLFKDIVINEIILALMIVSKIIVKFINFEFNMDGEKTEWTDTDNQQ